MLATKVLDTCYNQLDRFAEGLSFFPYTGAHQLFASSRARATYDKTTSQLGHNHRVGFIAKFQADREGESHAHSVMLFLTPIWLPLTIATFALALAIHLAALLTKLITYPIASTLDAAASLVS